MPPEPKHTLRIMNGVPQHCLCYGRLVKYTEGTKRGYDVYPVRTKVFQKTAFEHSQNRKDEWADVVDVRLAYGSDLHDAIYYQSCNGKFWTRKQIPQQLCSDNDAKRLKQSRPEEQERVGPF